MFNLNLNFAQPDFEHIFPVATIRPKNHARFGKYFELAAVGNLKNAPTVITRNDDCCGWTMSPRSGPHVELSRSTEICPMK